MKKERKPITTKELIAKLLELDPEGNQEVSIETPLDDYCGGWLYEENIQIDEIGGKNTIGLYAPY